MPLAFRYGQAVGAEENGNGHQAERVPGSAGAEAPVAATRRRTAVRELEPGVRHRRPLRLPDAAGAEPATARRFSRHRHAGFHRAPAVAREPDLEHTSPPEAGCALVVSPLFFCTDKTARRLNRQGAKHRQESRLLRWKSFLNASWRLGG